jgi:hypothetical protein
VSSWTWRAAFSSVQICIGWVPNRRQPSSTQPYTGSIR